MKPSPDLIPLVEAAYRTDLGDAEWLANACAETDKILGRGLGTGGWFMDASRVDAPRLWGYQTGSLRCPLDLEASNAAGDVSDFEAYFSKQAVGTGSGQVGVERWTQGGPRAVYEAAGAKDTLGIVAIDTNLVGCVLAIPLPAITRLSAREVRTLLKATAHLTAGQRVRSSLQGAGLEHKAEAILDPDGRVRHAEDAAKGPHALAALRHLAVEIDRARSSLRHDDPDRALDVWTALVSGRWTLLDHFDTDGRRFLVARRNDPRIAAPLALSERQRQVVALSARGHANKLIAYELGLSQPAIATHLRSAMEKLGVKTRVELVALLKNAALAATGSGDSA